ncbi:hypothetical protein PHMEG_00013767 [Phytophthora megakarya]|uniref:DDE Tnp4 domain-containing protein n=1 Tax=Phytophthora megakarya TaxID=4795 RepID=A0A225W5G4_9STRA|nr:hypothetical protein PHMEG_00013767 [Phytophthora megakarya]
MSDREAKDQFRFTVGELTYLARCLKLPGDICTREGIRSNPLEALGVCLRRLMYPKRWIDMAAMFGRAPSTLCHIFYYVVEFLDGKLEEFLYFDVDRITKNLDIYCDAIAAKEPRSIRGVWGFIDGTVRPICRPSTGQQAMYNGHKRVHAMKFQTVVTPDGLISHLFGPVDGRRHDMFMLNESGLKFKLEGNPAFHNKLIYGDPAYGCTNVFCCPYKGCRVNAPQKGLNKAMSAIRVSVEWSYGEVPKYFSFLDYKRHQRLPTTPTATLYKLGVFFTNCVTIARGGNNNSRYFRCKPPTFEEYFASYPNTK